MQYKYHTLLIESSRSVAASAKTKEESLPAYLPNLTAIRAIAALMVVVCHIELRKLAGVHAFGLAFSWGGLGVNIFFVLSGFLITYLLLKEKTENKAIGIKDFYVRRILKIWPLYFAVLFAAYFLFRFIMPNDYSSARYSNTSLLYNLLFLTNVTFVTSLTPLFISTIWSIGVEEQFYIFWPWLMKQAKQKLLYSMVGVVLLIPFLKLLFTVLYYTFNYHSFHFISQLITTSRFDLMGLGGLFAYVGVYKKARLFNKSITIEMLQSKKLQIIALFVFFLAFGLSMTDIALDLMTTIAGICSAVLIFNLALNKKSIIQLESKAGNYIGKISYGIYLLHMPVIYFVNQYITPHLQQLNVVLFNCCFYIIVLSITITCASLSYYLYEKPFLKLKRKFIHI